MATLKLKVIHVIDSGGMYGAERVVIDLMLAQALLGLEVTLASISERGLREKPIERRAREKGLEVVRIEFRRGFDRKSARRFLASTSAQKFDLVHTHGYKANTLISGISREGRGLPAVATLHGWTAIDGFGRMRIYESVERLMLRRADRIVAVSHSMVKKWKLESRYGQRISVISNGISRIPTRPELKSPFIRKIQEFSAGRKIVLAVGRLSHEKGFDILLRAIAMILRESKDVCLLLVGDGGKRGELEQLTKELDIEHAVSMPGYFTDIPALIHHCDVLAIPSRSEGLPIVLLEGLMCGSSVVATCVGDVPMVLSRVCEEVCVEPDNYVAFAKELAGKIDGENDGDESAAIAAKAIEAFSSEEMARQYFSLYSSILGRAG